MPLYARNATQLGATPLGRTHARRPMPVGSLYCHGQLGTNGAPSTVLTSAPWSSDFASGTNLGQGRIAMNCWSRYYLADSCGPYPSAYSAWNLLGGTLSLADLAEVHPALAAMLRRLRRLAHKRAALIRGGVKPTDAAAFGALELLSEATCRSLRCAS